MTETTKTNHEHTDEKHYWLNELADLPEKAGFFYGPGETDAGQRQLEEINVTFPAELNALMMTVSNGSDVRLHIILVAGVAALLYKYSGHNDIILGTPIYKQEIQGEFINTILPLRTRLKENITFKDLLLQLSRTIRTAAQNQNFPIESLFDRLNISYAAGEDFPLFDITILLENIHDQKYLRHLHTNLAFSFHRNQQSLQGRVTFNSLRCQQKKAGRLVAHLMNLLLQALTHMDLKLPQITILSGKETKQLLYEFNRTDAPYPENKTLHQLFTDQVQQRPQHIVLSVPIDLNDIYDALETGTIHTNLYKKLKHCRFKKSPYMFQSTWETKQEHDHLILLKTVKHNSVIVNNNLVKLIDWFNGQYTVESIFSRMEHLQLKFLIYFMKEIDLLEITHQFLPEPRLYTTGTFDEFVSLLEALYRHHLIELSGFNPPGHDFADPGTIPIPPATEQFNLQEQVDETRTYDDLTGPWKTIPQAQVLLLGDSPGRGSTGLLYLASYLKRNNISVCCQFYDPAHDFNSLKKNIRALLEAVQPKIAAISMKWFLYINRVFDICKLVKDYNPNIKILVGGNTASYYRDKIIRQDFIDYVIAGDGELPLLMLCRSILESSPGHTGMEPENPIPNFLYKKNDKIIETPISYLEDETNGSNIYLSHLDEYLISPRQLMLGTFFIYTHKGCAMNCLYCGGCNRAQEKTFNRKKVFRRGIKEVRQDIMAAKKFTSTFQFDLDIPAEHLVDYCRQLWAGIDLQGHFCIISTQSPPAEELIMLVSHTFQYIYWDFDICTLSHRHRRQLFSLGLVKPQPTDEDIHTFMSRCEKAGNIEVRLNLITGLPYFSPEDIEISEGFLSGLMHTYSCFGELHWARLHAQPGAPIVEDTKSAQHHDMYSFAITFADFLEFSRKNFNRQDPYPDLEQVNYPYIYFNSDELNSRVTRFYSENSRKIMSHKKNKVRQLPVARQWTFARLNEKANQLARVLRTRGVGPDSIVGVILEPALEIPLALLAIMKAGGVFLPIDPETPPKRISTMLQDCQVSQLLTKGAHIEKNVIVRGEKETPSCIMLDTDILKELPNESAGENPESTGQADDLAYVVFTSGSTGQPKGTALTKRNLANYIHWFIREAGLTHKDKSLLTSSFAFDLGYTSLFPPLATGGELHIIPREIYLSDHRFLNYIRQNRITYLKLTPSLFSIIANHPELAERMGQTLRLVVLGGEPINIKDVEQVHKKSPQLRFMNHYGPSEATIGCISTMIDFQKFSHYKQSPFIGKPIHNTSVYITDKNLNLVPLGIPGELCIAGTGIARGYLNRPQLTAEKFNQVNKTFLRGSRGQFLQKEPPGRRRQTLYKTGDLALWQPDGNIEFLGRKDNQIKIRGYRIELEEIQKQLLTHKEIEEAIVVARKARDGDKYITAYYVPAAPDKRFTLTTGEQTRYKRQMLLDGWGLASQEKLKRTTVFVAGAGGGASPTIVQLALAGFGTIIICDYDNVEISNLNRQFLHDESRIGLNKAVSAKQFIKKINPHIQVIPDTEKLTRENIDKKVGNAAIIFDMLDDLEGKFVLSRCAADKQIPHIIAAMTDISSYAMICHPPHTPCFHCIFDKTRWEELVTGMRSVANDKYQKNPLAVAAPSLFVSSGFAVNEAIKIILGIRHPAYNKFLFFNQGGTRDIAKSDGFKSMTYTYSDHFRRICLEQGFDWDIGWRGKYLEELDIVPDPACPVCRIKHLSPDPGKRDTITGKKKEFPEYPLSRLRDFLLQTLPEYMIPSYFVPLEQMPLTPNGKINKNALPEPGEIEKGQDCVPPRNQWEEKLAEIWAKVLGREKHTISMDANFFELGGHSLKVTSLVSTIQKEMKASLPLSEIFKTPTIEKLALVIKHNTAPGKPSPLEQEPLSSGDENLVLLKKGTNRPLHLFMVHAGGGEVEGYIEFCNHLNPRFNYWGIKASPLKNYAPLNITVAEIARKYLDKIKTVQPHGPYHIKGWCFGGTIAFEMVRQLEEMNESIGFFAIINSIPPGDPLIQPLSPFSLESEIDLLVKYLGGKQIKDKLTDVSRLEQLWPFILRHLQEIHVGVDTIRPLIPKDFADAIQNFDRLNQRELIYYLNLVRTHAYARGIYEPGNKIKTPVHFFSADDSEVTGRNRWNNYCSEPFKCINITGNHFSIYRKPEVEEFARIFDSYTKRNIK